MSKEKRQLVSIIIPVYNVERYLKKCIDSVINQTYANLEIILVDDGSPDGCGDICDDYAKKDKRIRVIHKVNGGLSDARNAGIDAATGDYIAFVDSDDYVASDYAELLYKACIEANADISCCSYYRVYGQKKIKAPKPSTIIGLTNIEALRDIFLANSLCEVMTWNKLYRRSLFTDNDIRFPVGKVHEDNYTTYKLFYFANKVQFIGTPRYFYLQRSESIMGRQFDKVRLDALEAVSEAANFMKLHQVRIENELSSYSLLVTLALLTDYSLSDVRNKMIESRLKSKLSSSNYLSNPLISKKHKLMYILARTGLGPYKFVRLAFKAVSRGR